MEDKATKGLENKQLKIYNEVRRKLCQDTKKVSVKICRKDRKIKYKELEDYQGILGEE